MRNANNLLDLLGDDAEGGGPALLVAREDFTRVWPQEPYPEALLDTVVITDREVQLTLDYPFERPRVTLLHSDAGFTLRQLIIAIRDGYQAMYRDTAPTRLPGLLNQKLTGPYGDAYHAIGDLVIERISYDPKTRQIDLGIGS